MTSKYILFLLLGVDALILFFQTSELSISSYETNILYGDFSFLQLITNISLNIFGHNDLSLRLPMMILHLFSVILLYLMKNYLKRKRNFISKISLTSTKSLLSYLYVAPYMGIFGFFIYLLFYI